MKDPAPSTRSPALIAAALLLLGAAPALGAGGITPYFHFTGVFHPATSHFPIALLMVAGGVELLRVFKRDWKPAETTLVCLLLGSLSAVVAAAAGWALADAEGEYHGVKADILFLHRWMGVGVGAVSWVALVLAVVARRMEKVPATLAWTTRLLIIGGAGAVGFVGSLGGKLTFGPDHYAIAYKKLQADLAAPDPSAPPAPGPASTDPILGVGPAKVEGSPPQPGAKDPAVAAGPAVPVAMPADGKVTYALHIKPLFDKFCVSCHGEAKVKGDYRLDKKPLAFKPGDTGEPPIVAGKADDSHLVKLVEGKGEHADDIMPPKGEKLSPAQIAIVRAWIDQGAAWPE